MPAVLRKVLLTVATGALAFLLTDATGQPLVSSLILTLLVSGIVLLVQLLVDVERRQQAVEDELVALRQLGATADDRMRAALRVEAAKIGDAIALHQQLERAPVRADLLVRLADLLGRTATHPPALGLRVAEAELTSAVDFLERILHAEEATTDGEDRDWLMALTRLAEHSLDAVSHGSQGPGDTFTDDGFWDTEIGVRYLESQREAIRRGVHVRRLFVVPNEWILRHPDFIDLCRQHEAIGVQVRMLNAATLSPSQKPHLPDMVLFDEAVTYELTASPRLEPSMTRYFVNTRLSVQPAVVRARIQLFRDLWELGEDLGVPPRPRLPADAGAP